MGSKRLLVIEDDRDILENMRDALELEGYEIYVAENGKEALELLCGLDAEQWPRCILLDLMMPIMDGMTFARILASNYPDTLAMIPAIAVTAKGGEIPELKGLGMVRECVRKPVDLDGLLASVSRYCGG